MNRTLMFLTLKTVELCSEPLIASSVLIDSISLYHTEEPQEIHLVPQALSYKVVGLSENGLMTIEKIGLQKLWLANTEAIGAKSLIHPTKLFHACVSAGLVPMFPAHQNTETCAPTNEEMRSYIMSVCLDNGLIKTILDIGEQWESGVHATSNCTLNFLFEWVWSSVSTAYKSVNGICDTLFSASGQELDVSLKRRLQLSRLILDRLYYIHTAFCSKYNHTLYADTLEPRLKAIDIITLFVHQVSWFMNVGLLPEANSKGLPNTAIRYDYLKLDRFAVDRRQRLNTLFAKFKKSGKSHELPGAGLYLVDHFVHDYNELGQQWEDEGGSNAYPPPSIQSLLRSLRIQTVPTSTKLALVQYTLLDIMSVIDKSKHEDLVSKVGTFHLLPKINATQTKVINGLWHLDHSLFEEGLQYLLDRTVTVSDLSEGLHRAILRMLLFEGKGKLAIPVPETQESPAISP
uniref:Protein ELYS n=2 Tax=Lygus hesperus TaxID=30085 RepID=A0A0A9YTW1_LYGHE